MNHSSSVDCFSFDLFSHISSMTFEREWEHLTPLLLLPTRLDLSIFYGRLEFKVEET